MNDLTVDYTQDSQDRNATIERKRLLSAKAALSKDFVYPQERCWARLEFAIQGWRGTVKGGDYVGELCNQSGIHDSGLSNDRKSGKRHIGKGKWLSMASTLKVNPDWLLKGYADDGSDVWSSVPRADIREGRVEVACQFLGCITDYMRQNSIPRIIQSIIQQKDMGDYNTNIYDSPPEYKHGHETLSELDKYLHANAIGLNAYFIRYKDFLMDVFSSFREFGGRVNYYAVISDKSWMEKFDPLDGVTPQDKLHAQFISEYFGDAKNN